MITVSFHRLAAEELRTAHAWYAARDSDVADRFQQTVDDAIGRICEDPGAQPVSFKHFRWVRVRRFPYRLIFEHADEDRILILAVTHTSRRSRYWRGRKEQWVCNRSHFTHSSVSGLTTLAWLSG